MFEDEPYGSNILNMSAAKEIEKFFYEKVEKSMSPLFSTRSNLENIYDKDLIQYLIQEKNILDWKNFKYPYKPLLLLAIYKENKTKEKLFNRWIEIDYQIIKNFYNFITNDYFLYEILENHKSKENWYLGINKDEANKIYNKVIKPSPINHLRSEWFSFDEKSIRLNFENPKDSDVDFFEQKCMRALKVAIPLYDKNFSFSDLVNFDDKEIQEIHTNGIDEKTSEVIRRQYQHIFRKKVLDRDEGKCVICCIKNFNILEACHIKPYAESSDIEKYDFNNGLTFCANHPILFDKGFFTFDDNWKVKIWNSLETNDKDLFFSQYEDCYIKIFCKFAKHKDVFNYLKYHRKNIFKR